MDNALILLRDWQESQIEFWQSIPGTTYDVSNFGRIRTWNTNGGRFRGVRPKPPTLVRTKPSSGGYVRVPLYDGQRRKRMHYLHRLVAQAFIPNPLGLPEVNHRTGLKADNRSDNLQWMTRSQNIQHSFDVGLRNNYMFVRREDYEYLKGRVADLEEQLEGERAENRRSERHWANMLLRAKQIGSFPLAEKARPIVQTTADDQLISADIDPGELAVQVADGAKFGYSAKEVENMMRKDRGLPLIS